MSLIFEFKCLLLNMEYVLMYVPKASTTVVSTFSLHVILLSKMTLGYIYKWDVPSV